MYRSLLDIKCPGVSNFPTVSVWRKIVPSKICFFMWSVAHNKILMQDRMKRQGWNLASRCELCCKEEETANHLLAECTYTKQVWNIIKRICRHLRFPLGNNIDTTLKNWLVDIPDGMEGWFSYCALHVVSWFIWIERNSRIFNGDMRDPDHTAGKTLKSVVGWGVANRKIDNRSAASWLRDCSRQIHG
ncbi:unnamed protein product [Linum trigynum]|uniref:Reverse transcriptase zinc-binding domain-containing protein n=1 Tax=Linum trigynum TaxID=586398 RepID=A0AAV2FBP0_9ROSI